MKKVLYGLLLAIAMVIICNKTIAQQQTELVDCFFEQLSGNRDSIPEEMLFLVKADTMPEFRMPTRKELPELARTWRKYKLIIKTPDYYSDSKYLLLLYADGVLTFNNKYFFETMEQLLAGN